MDTQMFWIVAISKNVSLIVKCYNFAKKNYLAWYHIPNADKRKVSVNFFIFIKSSLLEKLSSNTAVNMQEERVLSSDGITPINLHAIPLLIKMCKTGFQMFSFVAKSRQESTVPSAAPFCSHGIFPKTLVEKEVLLSHCKQDWFRRHLPAKWLRVLEDTLFRSVACWELVSEGSDMELPKVHYTHTSTTQLWGGFVLLPLNGNTKSCQTLVWKDE